jgi:hypothetical protein
MTVIAWSGTGASDGAANVAVSSGGSGSAFRAGVLRPSCAPRKAHKSWEPEPKALTRGAAAAMRRGSRPPREEKDDRITRTPDGRPKGCTYLPLMSGLEAARLPTSGGAQEKEQWPDAMSRRGEEEARAPVAILDTRHRLV